MRKRLPEITFILYLVILVLFFTDVPYTHALYIHVNPGQKIQSAINSANNGDIIIVHQGTYYERINFSGKAITIRSSDPNNPSIVANTIIDGGKAGSVVTFNNSEGEESVLGGFTIQNGRSEYGGGIYLTVADPTINECIITENTSNNYGGGIYIHYARPKITDCTFSKNSASSDGGGIYVQAYGCPFFTSCNITENFASHGGGISIVSTDVIITDCIITKNSAECGGGVYNSSSKPTFNNCVIRDNSATHDGGGIWHDNYRATVNDSIISGNSAFSRGGGVFCSNAGWSGWFKINNCTISQNLADEGSGIYCISSSTLTISNCNIIENSFGNQGGGIYCESSTPTITDSIISENSTNSGGGIYCKDASPTINNCKIIKNSSFFEGGGIYCRDSSSPIINNSDVNENSSNDGGGIYCTYYSSPYITNCIINKNKASDEGGGIYCYNSSPSITNCTMIKNSASYLGGGIFYSYSAPYIINSIFWDNSPDEIYRYGTPAGTLKAVYSNIKGGYPGEGNINKDPLFVDSNADDYHLLYGSPCIDTGINEGVPNKDKDGIERPQDGDGNGIALYDMGAYEYPKIIIYQMNIPLGWSMISLPIEPFNSRARDIFPDAAVIYGYKEGIGYVRINETDQMESGKGYWILQKQETNYTLIGMEINEYSFQVQDGWYMIGGCSLASKALSDNCSIGVIYGYLPGVGYKRLLVTETFEPGKGYWILINSVKDQASLIVGVTDSSLE